MTTGGKAKKRAPKVTAPERPSAKKAAAKSKPKAAAKAAPAPKTATRTRSDKKTLPFHPRKEKPTIPVAPPASPGSAGVRSVAKGHREVSEDTAAVQARSERTTKVEKLIKGAPKPAAPKPTAANVDETGLGWVDAGKGYQLALDAGKLVARNDKGKRLSSVPKDIKDGDVADQLEALRDWLGEHDRECVATVEQWMLRSLPVPRAVLEGVWADPAWRKPLENAVVVAVASDGTHDHAAAGLFRGVDAKKGVGVVDLDGETGWLAADRVALPHPILIPELDGWRELVTQLGVGQGIAQLHRQVYEKTHNKPSDGAATAITQFEDGKFNSLMAAVGKAKSLGYKVRGGFATCVVWDGTAKSEARYWIGADDPESETYTGHLLWVDGRERTLPIAQVGPVAFSEGMRMAAAIYAARVVEKKDET